MKIDGGHGWQYNGQTMLLVAMLSLLVLALLQIPTPPDVQLPTDIGGVILQLISAHQWDTLAWLIGTVVIGFVVRVLKGDTALPFQIPPTVRVWAAFGLGILDSVLFKVFSGATLQSALMWGLSAAIAAIIGHETIIESMRKGQEFHVPFFTKKLPKPIIGS